MSIKNITLSLFAIIASFSLNGANIRIEDIKKNIQSEMLKLDTDIVALKQATQIETEQNQSENSKINDLENELDEFKKKRDQKDAIKFEKAENLKKAKSNYTICKEKYKILHSWGIRVCNPLRNNRNKAWSEFFIAEQESKASHIKYQEQLKKIVEWNKSN